MSRLYAKEFGAWVGYNANAIYRKEKGQWVRCDGAELDKRYFYEFLATVEGAMGYVSLGDSIAAGHTINAEWATNYGEGSQYGTNGNTETAIVPDSYTDLIRKEFVATYGSHAFVKSFARSGDTVADLMDKLSHEAVKNALEKAALVTICIGANDVLQPALSKLDEYINTGSLANAESVIETNLKNLNTDSHPTSYVSLFNKLAAINPNAKYVFTTIYNPYKYLYLEGGHYGFFEPLLQTIPTIEIDVDEIVEDLFNIDDLGYWDILAWEWKSIELTADIDSLIKDGLLDVPIVQQLFDRVNGLSSWAEKYVEGDASFEGLNKILRKKIASYQLINPNFSAADTKVAFDLFPDKTDSDNDVDYSDLVSVEYTRTYDTLKMDWGSLWRDAYGNNPAAFWTDLAWKYLSFTNALPSTNVWDYVSFNLNGFAEELVALIIEKVILPDVDPHPEYRGHQVLKRSFTNALGLVKYEANGGSHIPGSIVYAGKNLPYDEPIRIPYTFNGWFTDAELKQELDQERTDYADSVEVFTLADLVEGSSVKAKTPKTTTLYAKWSVNK